MCISSTSILHTYVTLHCIALHYVTLHYIHYITLHYTTLHYITLHYLHYIILHYITYIINHDHTYIHTGAVQMNHKLLRLSLSVKISYYNFWYVIPSTTWCPLSRKLVIISISPSVNLGKPKDLANKNSTILWVLGTVSLLWVQSVCNPPRLTQFVDTLW